MSMEIVSKNTAAVLVIIALFAGSAVAQAPSSPSQVAPVQPVDPTKNVLDKVTDAVSRLDDIMELSLKRQDDLRIKDHVFQVAAREAADKRLADLATAETRRTNDLAQQKQLFDLELARILKASVDEKSLLLATQLREVKTDLSERMSKQEQFRWESGGKTQEGKDNWLWVVGLLGLLGMLITVAMGIYNATRQKS